MAIEFLPEIIEYEIILRTQKTPKGNNLSESSIKNYTQKINFLIKEKEYGNFFKTPQKLLEKLNEDYKEIISRKSALISIIKYLKTMGLSNKDVLDVLGEEYMLMSKEYTTKHDKNQKTETEEKNWIDYEDLLKYKSKIRCDPQFLALFKIYTEFPPLRNDVYNLKYKNYNNKKDNYLDLKREEIVINEYKESSVYGAIKLSLKKTLLGNLKKLAKQSQDDFVFHSPESKPFTDTKMFSAYFKRKFEKLTGKVIGTTMLRRIYISHFNKSNPTLEKRKQVAAAMGHSFQTGLGYDRKDTENKNLKE